MAAMAFLFLFIWAVRRGQYDDTYTPSVRILFDDDELVQQEQENKDKQVEEKKD